jgi:hypothetical protein
MSLKQRMIRHAGKHIPTNVRGGIYAILSVITCGAIFLAWDSAVISSPATAQATKKAQPSKRIDAIAKEFQKRRAAGECKVIAAGFITLFDTPMTVVQVKCPGNSEPDFGIAPTGREQEILTIALDAMNTGKPVLWGQEQGTITGIVYGNPQ